MLSAVCQDFLINVRPKRWHTVAIWMTNTGHFAFLHCSNLVHKIIFLIQPSADIMEVMSFLMCHLLDKTLFSGSGSTWSFSCRECLLRTAFPSGLGEPSGIGQRQDALAWQCVGRKTFCLWKQKNCETICSWKTIQCGIQILVEEHQEIPPIFKNSSALSVWIRIMHCPIQDGVLCIRSLDPSMDSILWGHTMKNEEGWVQKIWMWVT